MKSAKKEHFVTKQKVYSAIWSFWEEGIQPTSHDIRKRLGNRGSFTTICKYMREWHSKFMNEAVNKYANVINNMNDEYKELYSKYNNLVVENYILKQKIKKIEKAFINAGCKVKVAGENMENIWF